MSKADGEWKVQATLELSFVIQVNAIAEDEDTATDNAKLYIEEELTNAIQGLIQERLRSLKNVQNEENTVQLGNIDSDSSDVDNLETIETIKEPEDEEEEDEDDRDESDDDGETGPQPKLGGKD